jgi:hypothetical protein
LYSISSNSELVEIRLFLGHDGILWFSNLFHLIFDA